MPGGAAGEYTFPHEWAPLLSLDSEDGRYLMRGHTRTRRLSAVAAVSAGALLAAGSAFAATSPAISSFTPTKVKPVAKVTIAGKNLKGATAVMVDGTKMKFKVLSPTKIVVTLSTSAKSGQISVTTAHGTAKSTKTLTIT
jgi:hypothetical protein